jgi:hypothetical protein
MVDVASPANSSTVSTPVLQIRDIPLGEQPHPDTTQPEELVFAERLVMAKSFHLKPWPKSIVVPILSRSNMVSEGVHRSELPGRPSLRQQYVTEAVVIARPAILADRVAVSTCSVMMDRELHTSTSYRVWVAGITRVVYKPRHPWIMHRIS